VRTEKQREASRINGAKSRGPRTPEGKAISCMNAVRRDLLAGTVLIPDESNPHFIALHKQFFDEYRPLPGFETAEVESMVYWRWRGLRLMGIETAGLTHEIANHKGASQDQLSAPTHAFFATRNLTDNSRALTYIGRELTRCESHFNRAHRNLVDAQSKRGRKIHEIDPGVPPNPLETNESPAQNEPAKPGNEPGNPAA